MTSILVFDTETSGLIPSFNLSNLENIDIDSFPHIIQLSYINYDLKNQNIKCFDDNIINNDEIVLNDENIKIHKITNKMIKKSSYEIKEAIIDFMNVYVNADVLVGHNIEFDIKMLLIELTRLKKRYNDYNFDLYYDFIIKNKIKTYCTMKNSINICKIISINNKGKTYFKYPKLVELYRHYYSKIPNNIHNSFNDCLITLICYVRMKYNYDILNEKSIKEVSNLII